MSLSVYGHGLSANSFYIIMAADCPVSAQRRERGQTICNRLESAVLIAFAWLLQSSIVYKLIFCKTYLSGATQALKAP